MEATRVCAGAAVLARQSAEASLPALYRERAIAQASAAESDPTLPPHGQVGAERANYPDVFDVGSIAEDGAPPDDPWQLKSWLRSRDIRRRLIEAT